MSKLKLKNVEAILRQSNTLRSSLNLPTSPAVVKVITDIRKLKSGDIFLAYKGVRFDTHQHINEAIAKSAAAIVLDNECYIGDELKQTPYALVKNSRSALSWLVAAEWGNPETKLKFVGVTGTNGKTSTVWIIKELLSAIGIKALTIGTIGAWFGDEVEPTNHTTPDPQALFGYLYKAISLGITHVAMEVSSHALMQGKLGPIRFDVTAFTSFSQDHLDFHPTMEDYLEAKLKLFSEYLKSSDAIICISDDVWPILKDRKLNGHICIYGDDEKLQEWHHKGAKSRKMTVLGGDYKGSKIRVHGRAGERLGKVPFLGGWSVKNFLAALVMVEELLGIDVPSEFWTKVRPVPGRLEPVVFPAKPNPFVFVDYAHTPDAIEKTLLLLKPLCANELWIVFGCGGDRDRSKRPLMARAAEALADRVVVTSDNPRTEDPATIIQDIMVGLQSRDRATIIVSREDAIKFVLQNAQPMDTVLIAGKGHEDYQIIGNTKHHFDDREIAYKYMSSDTSG